jgi:hypothetical protein
MKDIKKEIEEKVILLAEQFERGDYCKKCNDIPCKCFEDVMINSFKELLAFGRTTIKVRNDGTIKNV